MKQSIIRVGSRLHMDETTSSKRKGKTYCCTPRQRRKLTTLRPHHASPRCMYPCYRPSNQSSSEAIGAGSCTRTAANKLAISQQPGHISARSKNVLKTIWGRYHSEFLCRFELDISYRRAKPRRLQGFYSWQHETGPMRPH